VIEGLGKGLLRCGYCHGEAHGLLEGCSECGILLHADCRRALGRCPTLGCQTPSVQVVPVGLAPPDESPDPPEAPPEAPPRWARIREAGFSGLLLSLHRVVLPCAVLSGVLMGGYTLVDAFAHTYRNAEAEAGGISPKTVQDACRRFRVATGRWPESLDELVSPAPSAYLEGWPTNAEGQDFVLIYRGREAWLGTQVEGPASLELHTRLFVKPAPVAACGLPPQPAHVRAHQLTRGNRGR
jgi:hypothetical protein